MTEKVTTTTEKRQAIEHLGLSAIEQYFGVDVATLNPDVVKNLHNKARVAMQFEKEINVSKRAVEGNYLRVFKLVAEDKKELKKLITKSLPQYYK